MTDAPRRPARIVDAHVHFWDPANTDWYPYLSGGMALDMGNTTGMNRRFDLATYRTESAGWNVEKRVHVAAATGASSIDETIEIDRKGEVDAIIGGITPTDTVAEAATLLDRQAAASRFRGVRPMGRFDGPLPSDDVLRLLAERDLLFELLARPDQLAAAAGGLAGVEDLVVVVEHTGWPRTDTEDERTVWRHGLAALAGLGDRVHCKLSGVAMAAGSMDPGALASWLEPAIELFGVDRCFFARNFPVDGLHGSLDELWAAYATVAAGLGAGAVDQLFAANAEALYRC
jgi:predicted TIM-barrel fold metal-dependent hydrolase